jgi:hypothetical protein
MDTAGYVWGKGNSLAERHRPASRDAPVGFGPAYETSVSEIYHPPQFCGVSGFRLE